jgi:2-dehydropantoate 2-reductase
VKIIVMGAGALGSIAAALLHAAGHEVALVGRGARAAYLAANGVTLAGHATLTARVPIVTDTDTLRQADLLLMAVKTFDNAAALRQLAHVQPKACLSFQNGMAKEGKMAAVFGPAAVLLSTANFSGGVRADGVTDFTVNLGVAIGELGGGVSPRVREVCAAFGQAGLKSIAAAPDVATAARLVQQAGGVFLKSMPQHKPPILQALEAGRRLEIEATLGDVIARADRHGVPVPTIDAGYRLLAAIDRIAQRSA